jgi:hypothetical protein
MAVAGGGAADWVSGMGFSLNGGCALLFLNVLFLPQMFTAKLPFSDGQHAA